MLLDLLLISVAVAVFRGGRFNPQVPMEHSWGVLVAAGLQILAALADRSYSPYLIIAGYMVLLLVLIKNLNRQSLSIIFVGVLLNMLVIGVNGGRMPVSIPAAERLGFDTRPLVESTDFKRTAMSPTTRFNFLGDVIYVPVPLPRVISIGDVAIAVGAFLFVQDLMGKPITLRTRRLIL